MEALQTSDSSRESGRSGHRQHGPLPLLPPLPPLLQFSRGLREEGDILFALELPLEELHRRAVEAHHVLAGGRGGDEEEPGRVGGFGGGRVGHLP